MPGTLASYGLVLAVALAAVASTGRGQAVLSLSQSSPQPKSDHADRCLAAIDLAVIAARSGAVDVSVEAMRRACRQGPPVSSVDLGGILGSGRQNSAVRVTSSSGSDEATDSQRELSQRLQELQQAWKECEIEPAVAYEAWKAAVFPPDRPNEGFTYSTLGQASTSISYGDVPIDVEQPERAKSGAEALVYWARQAGRMDDLKSILETRRILPGAADTVRLIDMLLAADESASDDAAEALCEQLVSDAPSLVNAANADLLIGCAWELVNRLDDDSPAARRLTDAVLREIRNKPRWGANEWFKYLVATNLKQSIESGDLERFNTAVELSMSYYDELSAGNQAYVTSREANLYATAARMALEQGHAKLGTACLQSLATFPTASRYGGVDLQQLVNPSNAIMQSLMKMPREERYDVINELAWNLPALGMHDCTHTRPTFDPPELFRTATNPFPSRQVVADDALLITLLEWSMRDAIALGKQSEVEDRIAELEQDGSDDARIARLAYQFANDEPIDLAEFISTDDEGNAVFEPVYPNRSEVHWLDVVLARHALQSDEHAEAAREFAQERWERALSTNYHYELAWLNQFRLEARESYPDLVTDDDLMHWVVGTDTYQSALAHGRPNKTRWIKRDGDAWGHAHGPDVSYLWLKYPITGDYTVTFRSKDGLAREGGAAAAGRLVEFMSRENQVWLWGVANRGRANIQTSAIKRDAMNHYRIECLDGQVKLVIGDDAFELPLGRASEACPFFSMMAYHFRPTTFDSVEIKGDYSIPSSVDLASPMMMGWSTRWFTGDLPAVTAEAEEDQPAFDESSTEPARWRCVDGVIESVPQEPEEDEASADSAEGEAEDAPRDAYIYYLRPLCDGEQVSFEFYYEPGKYTVAPCVGRIAMLLTEPEIPLHWVACDISEWTGVQKSNRVVDPAAERLGPVELDENAWNRVILRLNGDHVTVSLNGQDVYRRAWEPDVSRQFGLFQDPAQFQIRVRNIQLSGDWPDRLPVNLMAYSAADDPESQE